MKSLHFTSTYFILFAFLSRSASFANLYLVIILNGIFNQSINQSSGTHGMHRASMNSRQKAFSCDISLNSHQSSYPTSLCIVLSHISLGLPRPLLPCALHSGTSWTNSSSLLKAQMPDTEDQWHHQKCQGGEKQNVHFLRRGNQVCAGQEMLNSQLCQEVLAPNKLQQISFGDWQGLADYLIYDRLCDIRIERKRSLKREALATSFL